jgi:putative hydrolase of the HAD superfamily
MTAITDSATGSIEGIVLDAVGTLIEPVPSVSHAYAHAAKRQGVEIDIAVLKSRFRASFRVQESDAAADRWVTDEACERRRWRRIVAECLPEVPDHQSAFEELWVHFGDPKSWRVYSDVEPALRVFRRSGIRLCIGSNFDSRLRQVVSGLPPLAGWPDPLLISSEIGFRKPHPSFYLAAARALNLRGPEILSVGDDRENDGNGAIRAGLRSHLIVRTNDVPDGVPWSASLADLASLLERG